MIRLKQISYYAAVATTVNGVALKCVGLIRLGIQKREFSKLGVKVPLDGRVTTYYPGWH
jgi:hypothetical protein